MDAQIRISRTVPSYVVLYEPPQIRPINQERTLLTKYRRVFTWRDDLVDGERYIKLNLPNKIVTSSSFGWTGRDKLCCMISANKTVPYSSPLYLYSERVETIRWFEQHAPQDFDLFGIGWNKPVARHGLPGRMISKLQSLTPNCENKMYFTSYRGTVFSKLETFRKYRFSICYENVRDLPGHITEKIFDSFFAGCVPVYWGASNITTYIPENCFIDRREFTSHEELYKFMVSMTESDYTAYQERIFAFLTSDRVRPFSADIFAETIVNTIVSDLGIAGRKHFS
ncbi:MAG: glycosyltransferase family 10 [Porphyromonadaceae bacterium]|nr:glycosyltransferase family 10 [Porphyromonadaceae bacterium]